MNISCIIIEDQPHAQRLLQKYIAKIGVLELKGTFTDGIAALLFLKEQSVDLIFLDIHLPQISGIEVMKILSPKPKVILTTAFSGYALESYELDVTDYLLKPFPYERFVKAVSKVLLMEQKAISIADQAPAEIDNIIFIKSGHDYLKIDLKDIKYIKSDGDYTVVCTGDSNHLVSHSLKYWLKNLPADFFCQIRKSCLVNVKAIEKISNNHIHINKQSFPIGRTFKDALFKKYLRIH